MLSDPNDPIDVTFNANEVDEKYTSTLNSRGSFTRIPFLFLLWPIAGAISSLGQAKGMRIDVGPEGSIRAQFAAQVLAAYGVTEKNSVFLHLP